MAEHNYPEKPKTRYLQMDRALKLNRETLNTNVPYYNSKTEMWSLGDGAEKQEDVYLDRLLQDYSGVKLQYRYKCNGETFTRRIFAEVLEDMLTRFEMLSIDGFEEDYSSQQIEWLAKVRQRLIDIKGNKQGDPS